jgi:hypothetical protein
MVNHFERFAEFNEVPYRSQAVGRAQAARINPRRQHDFTARSANRPGPRRPLVIDCRSVAAGTKVACGYISFSAGVELQTNFEVLQTPGRAGGYLRFQPSKGIS